nr:bis(5'-nucleosyl)-tetraphosphatase (symmetrical) YqeK [Lachnospiraceae bacterium]
MYLKNEAKVKDDQQVQTDESFLQNLTAEIEDALDEKRFRHTLSVAHTAACLAMRYDESPFRAYLAGLLHDCAKCLKNKKKLELAREYGLGINAAEEENPDLLHAKLGSILAKERYNIDDEEILSAIRYHTTGKPEMTKLEKIIYIADYIEIHRKPLPLLEKARKAAFA